VTETEKFVLNLEQMTSTQREKHRGGDTVAVDKYQLILTLLSLWNAQNDKYQSKIDFLSIRLKKVCLVQISELIKRATHPVSRQVLQEVQREIISTPLTIKNLDLFRISHLLERAYILFAKHHQVDIMVRLGSVGVRDVLFNPVLLRC
jgi:hypothetical protein